MKHIFNVLEKASDITYVAAKYLIIAIMLTMLFSTTLQVVCRYVFSSALSWPEEINVFFMAWITFVGSSMGLKTSEHINVDLILKNLSPPMLAWVVRFIGHLIMGYIVLMIIRFGASIAMMNIGVFSEALELPLAVPRFSLAVGGLMMLIQLLNILGKDLRSCPWVKIHAKKESVA